MSEWNKFSVSDGEYLVCACGDVDLLIHSGRVEMLAAVNHGEDGVEMTPTQARMVAAKLIELADSLEKQGD